MARVCILLMDSFAVGAAQDAPAEDQGANTFGHFAAYCHQNKRPLNIPHLLRWGVHHALHASCGHKAEGLPWPSTVEAAWGYAVEQSAGKDTPSGHWELAGVPVFEDWGYFRAKVAGGPCFPPALMDALVAAGNLPGVLGCRHASGTEIIKQLGDEHVRSGKPIVYTSGDSVFQIAAHEQAFGLEALYALCDQARVLVDDYRIGRVIARPFVGEAGNYQRTANRRDLATPPPAPTLLDQLKTAGVDVVSVGKIADIFAHRGISRTIKAAGNQALFDATLDAFAKADGPSLVFSNFVDFDSSYGHRRDVAGYAQALEDFDRRLPELEALLAPEDMVIIAADHGCDPTFPGSDHTREHIPVLVFGPKVVASALGRRASFADVGQTIAECFAIAPLAYGESFLSLIKPRV
jgi:phosphopentomutase